MIIYLAQQSGDFKMLTKGSEVFHIISEGSREMFACDFADMFEENLALTLMDGPSNNVKRTQICGAV